MERSCFPSWLKWGKPSRDSCQGGGVYFFSASIHLVLITLQRVIEILVLGEANLGVYFLTKEAAHLCLSGFSMLQRL